MPQTALLPVLPDSSINCRAGVPWDVQLPSKLPNQTKPHCSAQVACHLNQLSCWIWELFVTQTHIHQWLKRVTATTEWIVFKLYFLCAAAAAYVVHTTFHPELFLGTFTKLQKPTICFIMSAYLSICPSIWNNSALTGTIFIKLGIWEFFENLPWKFKFH